MSARELKAALVELGARTDGLFDKDSLRQALIEARAKPPPSSSKDSFSTTSSPSSTSASTSVGASGKAMEEISHAERVERALSDIRGNGSVGSNYPMSVKEMKQQLAALGVSVAGFFERSEFELALAEAVAACWRCCQRCQCWCGGRCCRRCFCLSFGLVLGLNLTDTARLAEHWLTVTNADAIAVNQVRGACFSLVFCFPVLFCFLVDLASWYIWKCGFHAFL